MEVVETERTHVFQKRGVGRTVLVAHEVRNSPDGRNRTVTGFPNKNKRVVNTWLRPKFILF